MRFRVRVTVTVRVRVRVTVLLEVDRDLPVAQRALGQPPRLAHLLRGDAREIQGR